jgi:N-acetylgalactosamine kinase
MSGASLLSVILAAGKGTRMQSTTCHKVCFAIDGIPAINRALAIYEGLGLKRHIVVVGTMAGQVMETVGRAFKNVLFAYQAEQTGTADAARVGLQAATLFGGDPDLLLVAGDRIIEPGVLDRLFALYEGEACDLAFLASPGFPESTQGRIVETADGQILGIVEEADIRQRQVFRDLRSQSTGPRSRDEIREFMRQGFSRPGSAASDERLATAFGRLWTEVKDSGQQRVDLNSLIPEGLDHFEFKTSGGEALSMTPEDVRNLRWMNTSVYVLRASSLGEVLGRLDQANAQGEEYLSGIVGLMSREAGRFKVRALHVEDPEAILGYNNPAEILAVESVIQARKKGAKPRVVLKREFLKPISVWQGLFDREARTEGSRPISRLRIEFEGIYGADEEVLRERFAAYRDLLAHSAVILGESAHAFIVRSSGRLNVLGRHIDHQGGNCNLMTIGYETLMAVRPRDDDRIRLFNLDRNRFGDRDFSIGDLVADLPWDDWLSLINSEKALEIARNAGGDWSQYFKAAVLRLQKKFPHLRLRGMDIVVTGNIPQAAGLSSSSSLVVGTAEATIATNGLDLIPAQFVDLCGEGEWFVGTRGGSADHAAVKMGRKGKVIKVAFFNFAVQETVDFPDDYVMVVGDSGHRAQKSAKARDEFNHRVACYRLGLRLVRAFYAQHAPLLNHLRDINVRNLRVPLSWIYRILLNLPEQATRDELRALLPEENLDSLFMTHEPPFDGLYPIRGVVLFGLAECERARVYADHLRSGRIAEIGRMMRVSHDGDRVVSSGRNGEVRPFRAPTSNGYLLGLMEDLESEDPVRVERAQLIWQPGRYACSLPSIDRMVDIALETEGVAGAQLAGAGLGGCMMVLARREAVPALRQALVSRYYEAEGQPPSILVCRPIAGSGLMRVEESNDHVG